MTVGDVVQRLSGAKTSGNGYVAKCPAHEDHRASLSLGTGDAGRILVHCHAGCTTEAIAQALDLTVGDLFSEPRQSTGDTESYPYYALDGTLLHEVVRGPGKRFRQRRPKSSGDGWIWKSSGQRVPYRWPELVGKTTVFVVEGEKDADTLWAQEPPIPSTTNIGGAGKFRAPEAQKLADIGVTTIYVIPDNDEPGRMHAQGVLEACRGVGLTATLVVLENLPEHGDVTDWFKNPDHTPEKLLAQAAAAPETPLVGTAAPTLEAVAAVPDFLSSASTFTQIAEGQYSLDFPELGVTLACAYLRRERQRDLHGELVVHCSIAGSRNINGILSSSNMNFSSQPARQKMATFLAGRSKSPELDWISALEIFCFRITEAETTGSPIKPLADYDLPSAVDHWLVDDIPILKDHPMVVFGDGGTSKSMLALHISIKLAQNYGVRVLYADWEFSPESHRDRLGRLAGSNMPVDNLHYVRCVQPLIGEQTRLEQHIRKEGIEYLICDSVAFAVPGRPEDAEHAASYYRALRHLGIGSLNIAHTSKNVETGQNSPFGSVYWSNGARSIWHVKRSPGPSPTPSILEIALTHKKTNTGGLLPPKGIRFVFLDTETRVESLDLATSDLSGALPIWQRIRAAIELTPLSVKDLAEELEEKPETIARTVRRMDIFHRDEAGLVHVTTRRNEMVL